MALDCMFGSALGSAACMGANHQLGPQGGMAIPPCGRRAIVGWIDLSGHL